MSELVNVVWAKMTGYPWWPGIEECTFTQGNTIFKRIRFFTCNKHADFPERFVKDYLSNYETFKNGSDKQVSLIQDFKNDLAHADHMILENLKKSSKSKPSVKETFTLQVKTKPESVSKDIKTNSNLLKELKILTFCSSDTLKSSPSCKELAKISKDLGRMVNKFRTSDLLMILIKIQKFSCSVKDLKDFKLTKIMKLLIFTLESIKGDIMADLIKVMKFVYLQWKIRITKNNLELAVELDGLKESFKGFEKVSRNKRVVENKIVRYSESEENSFEDDESVSDFDENDIFQENELDLDEKYSVSRNDSDFNEKNYKNHENNLFDLEELENTLNNQRDILVDQEKVHENQTIFEIKPESALPNDEKQLDEHANMKKSEVLFEAAKVSVNFTEIIMPQAIRMCGTLKKPKISQNVEYLKEFEKLIESKTTETSNKSEELLKYQEILNSKLVKTIEKNVDTQSLSIPGASNTLIPSQSTLETEIREDSMKRNREKTRKSLVEAKSKTIRKKTIKIPTEKSQKASQKKEKKQKCLKSFDIQEHTNHSELQVLDLTLQETVFKKILKVLLENGFKHDKSQELSVLIEENLRKRDPSMGEKYKKFARIMLKDIKTLDNHSFEHVTASLV